MSDKMREIRMSDEMRKAMEFFGGRLTEEERERFLAEGRKAGAFEAASGLDENFDKPGPTVSETKRSGGERMGIYNPDTKEVTWLDHQPTLRDQFAMAALTGMLAYSHVNPMRGNYHENCTVDNCVETAYMYADAMVEARKK